MRQVKFFVAAALALCVVFPALAQQPSRPAVKGCEWQKFSDPKSGLEAWLQRCDFGFRKIDFVARGGSILQRFSDGGEPDAVIDVIPLLKGEDAVTGVKRVFASHTDPKIARRCVIAPYTDGAAREGVKRFTFVPDAAYQKELDRTQSPDEVGDPPCGDWGTTPDGIQYFEVQAGASIRNVLFVRVGQDEPLFDENTLKLLPAPAAEK